jgi:AAA domain
MALSDETLRWFKTRRGIDSATLEAFGIEQEAEGIKLPYPDGAVKHRATLEKVDGKHRMWFEPKAPDGRQRAFLPPNFSRSGKFKITVEGESDTMATWQNAPADIKPHIVGLSGSNAFGDKGMTDDKIAEYFGEADIVFAVMDNEDPYTAPEAYASVERGKANMKKKLGKKVKFVQLPQGPNDMCEFFIPFDWAAFAELLTEARQITYHYPALDFKNKEMEFDWLVKDLLVRGDICTLNGDPGVGKSWLGLDLAVAMMMERQWLGMDVEPGKVMVIDQENPKVTAFRRMAALGLDDDVALEKLRYLWYAGIRLDQEEAARKFYEDAENFEPDYLLVDSLSRVHFRNENSAEEMNPLFNGGIYPIARDLNCTIVLIHHLNKQGGQRGSTAIKAAGDLNLDVVNIMEGEDKTGWQAIIPDKLRNIPEWGASLHCRRVQDDLGNVRITTEEGDSPF